MITRIRLIIKAIDYDSSRGYPQSFLPKFKMVLKNREYPVMDIDYSKKAIDFAKDLLYNITGIQAGNWISLALSAYEDDIQNGIITIVYSCLIPYKELNDGEWVETLVV